MYPSSMFLMCDVGNPINSLNTISKRGHASNRLLALRGYLILSCDLESGEQWCAAVSVPRDRSTTRSDGQVGQREAGK